MEILQTFSSVAEEILAKPLLNTYIFLLQVEDVINSFFHVLRESCHSHTVGIRSSTLGKANIHLQCKRPGLRSEKSQAPLHPSR